MDSETRTTETLREILFKTLDGVSQGTTDLKTAQQVANLADKILKTADIELKYSLTVSRLDKQEQGISPGPLLLTQKAEA